MRNLIFAAIVAMIVYVSGNAQVRPVGDDESKKAQAAAPASLEVRYEGGMYGYSQKESGKLKFDDANQRLIFIGKDGKEKFSVPYDSMLLVYPNAESVTSKTGNVVKYIPLPGAGLAGLLKEKRRYLVIGFDDPDVNARGTVSFRVDNKEALDAVIQALGTKAKLSPRGDAYYRAKTSP